MGYSSAEKTKAKSLIAQLKALNKSGNKSEIEKLISAMGRNFGKIETFSFPGEALGYTGKVGTTTTAGKALD